MTTAEGRSSWGLVGATAVLLSATVGRFLAHGVSEEALHELLRVTARTSLMLFLVTFLARPIRSLSDGEWARWLLGRRKYLGLSFATAMVFHLATLVGLASLGEQFPGPIVVAGGAALLFVVAMTVTSFPGPTRALGGARWKALHKTGLWSFFVVFLYDYWPSAEAKASRNGAFALLVLAALWRGLLWWKGRSNAGS